MKRIALAVLICLAIPAQADASAPASWQAKALATAQRVWHPACGTLTLTFGTASESIAGAAGWAALGDCAITLDARSPWRSVRLGYGYPVFCSVVLHEAGHAAGHEHTQRGIMAAERSPSRGHGRANGHATVIWYDVDRRCVRPMDRRP